MKRTHLLFLLTLLACGERAPTGVRAQPLLLDPPAVGATLLRCSPLAPDSVSQTMGAMGGVVYVGPHQLSVPPGALDAPITITAVAPADTVNRVRFGPEGLTFQQPASLTMSYANCDALASLAPKQIAYTGDALAIVELLPSVDQLWTRTVTASLEHFSDYAIAW